MKKLLNYLNSLYKDQLLEKQYLVFQDQNNKFHHFWISNDVSDSATNSSFEKFTKAVLQYKEINGKNPVIVHNHPKVSPEPSLMDYKNAELLNTWASILAIEIADYMVFSKYGYYSFFEANEWSSFPARKQEDFNVLSINIEEFNFNNLLKIKDTINEIFTSNDEIIITKNKIYYSKCLPLENLKKEVENEDVKFLVMLKNDSNIEKTYQTFKRFLNPMTIIEVTNNGEWDTLI
ncbi:JAB domain-containing protein [Bacillus sp. Brlt_9]|uniref:JAB domain-containing protein n=1 Tax=Bacillus sp. Brlt_9 TaxID=3110916 RepID=UPI003F7B4EA8